MTANYMLITVAACEPAYVQEALGHVGPSLPTYVRHSPPLELQ